MPIIIRWKFRYGTYTGSIQNPPNFFERNNVMFTIVVINVIHPDCYENSVNHFYLSIDQKYDGTIFPKIIVTCTVCFLEKNCHFLTTFNKEKKEC